ncbi:MAG: SDR family NAD(P)-dependent oxidoreductase [Halioglobus sp.]|nr:SDR family NAD(P)-dependent oxidoreductase [Halioglobus sp.]
MDSFAQRYGPWAVILGASDGTGAAFARRIAAAGVHCILIARREQPLADLAEELTRVHGIECVIASVDLAGADACAQVVAAAGEREVGLLVTNAGADPYGALFLEQSTAAWESLLAINITNTLRCCHHFSGQMRERRRGGLLLVGSGACRGGAARLATYSGAKAFVRCFAESLWQEMKEYNVHVLHLELTTTDTPSFHKLLAEKGRKPLAGMASPDDVARVGLARLPRGPNYFWGQKLGLRASLRRARVRLVSHLSGKYILDPAQADAQRP